MDNRELGLTLIELMIVVAIIGILAAFAVKPYKEYVKRGYIIESLSIMHPVKLAVAQYYHEMGTLPDNNSRMMNYLTTPLKNMLLHPIQNRSEYNKIIKTFEVIDNGVISIIYRETVCDPPDVCHLFMVPKISAGSIGWECSPLHPKFPHKYYWSGNSTGVPNEYLPTTCRAPRPPNCRGPECEEFKMTTPSSTTPAKPERIPGCVGPLKECSR